MTGILSFEQSNNGKVLTITDASKWGEETNPALTDITRVQVAISYDGTTYTNVIDEDSDDWVGSTPTQDELEWEVDVDTDATFGAAVFGSDDIYYDGIYTLLYTVTVGSGTFSPTTHNIMLDYNVEKGVADAFKEQPYKFTATNIAYDEDIERNLLLESFLRVEKYSSRCGLTTKANDILETLQDLLES